MIQKDERSKGIIKTILKAMAITSRDLRDSWEKEISNNNNNGLPAAVWAKRCESLTNDFNNEEDIDVLHIKRGGLWQIDPVFDTTTGVLYLLFNSDSLYLIKRKYFKNSISRHYSVSLLLMNEGLITESNEQLELFPANNEEEQRKFKIEEINKMLGKNAENVKSVVIVSADYYSNTMIEARLELYTPNFSLVEVYDVTKLIPNRYNVEELLGDVEETQLSTLLNVDSLVEKPIVKLRDTVKENNNI